MNSFKAIFIDDTCRPEDFPISKWPVKNKEYTVIDIKWLPLQETLGFIIAEIDLTGIDPYRFFNAKRFLIPHMTFNFSTAKKEIEKAKAKEEVTIKDFVN